jgi:hypothetical protein
MVGDEPLPEELLVASAVDGGEDIAGEGKKRGSFKHSSPRNLFLFPFASHNKMKQNDEHQGNTTPVFSLSLPTLPSGVGDSW